MPKINGNEIRPGMVIEYEGSLWVAVKTVTVKPGKGPAYNQVELKNLLAVAFSTTSLTSRHPVGTHAVRALSASGVVVGGSPAHRTS